MLSPLTRSKIRASFRASKDPSILLPTQILRTFRSNRHAWSLPTYVNESNIVDFLLKEGGLRDVSMITTCDYPSIRRYAWSDVSAYRLALSARPNSYFSHGTALALHGLTQHTLTTLYVNQEQSPKPIPSAPLTQEGINRAFSNRQRLSQYTLKYQTFRIMLLSGKHTGRLGATQVTGPEGEQLPVTGIERTLIDIVVRPAYADRIADILEAFRGARRKVSVDRLIATLKKLGHAYPYHQAIGFCLERAGFPEPELHKLERLGIVFRFYLAHAMKEPSYSKRWRVFYPRGL